VNVTEIIKSAAEDGVKLAICSDGTANISGDAAMIAHWAPILRAHKPAIVTALHKAAELRALVAAVYSGETDADRADALAAALADPDDALTCYRSIVAETRATIAKAKS
jgi:hypothetical protein